MLNEQPKNIIIVICSSLFYMMTIFLIFHIRCLAENMQSKHIFTSGKNLKNNQNTEFYSKITNMKL